MSHKKRSWYFRQRQQFILDTLNEKGHVNTTDIIKYFEISRISALKDIKDFMEANPGILEYNSSLKYYVDIRIS